MDHVEFLGEPRCDLVVDRQRNCLSGAGNGFGRPHLGKPAFQGLDGFQRLVALFAPVVGDRRQDLREPGAAIA